MEDYQTDPDAAEGPMGREAEMSAMHVLAGDRPSCEPCTLVIFGAAGA